MELNKTEDNKCCFLHFGRGVQDPFSGTRGGGPWTPGPPPPGSAPVMEAWLSSFPMIPISLVYSFSGMNDSFMNGVGVPSVKCQISISAGIGGPYLPQYNIFCYMSYLITEAWLSSFPMIPISLVYSFSGMNDSFMNEGIGGQYLPQYSISAGIGQCYSVYCSIFCAQFTHIVSQVFFVLLCN